MGRPSKSGRDASREALDYANHWLCQIVDLMSEELNFRQRHKLRIKVLNYLSIGDRRREKDLAVQSCFEFIVTTYINTEETL